MNVIEYIEKYGNLNFNEKPFNNVDKLIFANLSYVDYVDTISNNDKNKRKLEEVANDFFNKKYQDKKNILAIKGGIKLLKLMASTKRYKDLLLYSYIHIVDNEQQFSAITIELNPTLVYVSFEGTDEMIIGWEEDFKLSYQFPVPSQRSAIKYLNKFFTFKKCDIIVGGHSKGGNLSLTVGMYSNFIVRHKIKEIYSFDGPGLLKKQLNSFKYRRVQKKYKHIVPNNSMIGMMLYSKENFVIKTNYVGLLSHYALNWQVDEFDFIKDNLLKSSIILSESLSKWIEKYNNKQKKQFVSEMFEVFKKNNVNTLLDFLKRPTALIKILSDSNKVSKQTSIMFREFVSYVRKFMFQSVKEKIIK